MMEFDDLAYDRRFKEIVVYENEIILYIYKLVSSYINWNDLHAQGKKTVKYFVHNSQHFFCFFVLNLIEV